MLRLGGDEFDACGDHVSRSGLKVLIRDGDSFGNEHAYSYFALFLFLGVQVD